MAFRRTIPFVVLAIAVAAVAIPLAATGADTPPGLKVVGQDKIVDGVGMGRSALQPSMAATPASQTIVAAFEVHRIFDGGSAAIGWVTSTNGGTSWGQRGLLPLTVAAGGPTSGSIFPVWRAADPSVAYDARYGQWLVASRALGSTGNTLGIAIDRSVDGISWSAPIVAHQAGTGDTPGKPSLTCDNSTASSGYGNCYLAYGNTSSSPVNQLEVLTSTDAGQTWSAPGAPADAAVGTSPAVVVQPPATTSACGRVVVPYANSTTIDAFSSTDCGASWSAHSVVSSLAVQHTVAQGLRSPLTPSVTSDGAGRVYLAWPTRSFRITQTTLAAAASAGDTNVKVGSATGMVAGNTLTIDAGAAAQTVTITVVGTSGATGTGVTFTPALVSAHATGSFVTVNGVPSTSTAAPNDIALSVMPAPTVAVPEPSFGAAARVPIEADVGASSNTVDHFIPSLAADPRASGNGHLALFYYFYPVASCSYVVDIAPTPAQCRPSFGYVSSTNGGSTWSAPATVASMPSLAVLVRGANGPDLGAYTSSVIPSTGVDAGRAFSVFSLGVATGGLDESMYVPLGGLAVGGGS